MADPGRDFQKSLLATFRAEAEEHLQVISAGLLDLEKPAGPEQAAQVLEKVLREAHSLKGAARAVDLRRIEEICQSMETELARVKRHEVELGPSQFDALHASTAEMRRVAAEAQEGGGAARPAEAAPEHPTAVTAPEDSVRVSRTQLDRLLLQVEGLVPERWTIASRSAELRALLAETKAWQKRWAPVRQMAAGRQNGSPSARPLREFLEWNEDHHRRIETGLLSLSKAEARHERVFATVVDSLLADTRELLLRPFSSILEALPPLVRDLCRQQGKQALLRLHGSELEVDRRILQEIKDPLLHLVRNSIDHGIEPPARRAGAGKGPQGVVQITIAQMDAEKVEIEVSDDGAGIDTTRVKEAALKLGLVDEETSRSLTAEETYPFIFQSGLTTSPAVTEVSGRGLGMVIVREKVERLGGHLSLKTHPGQGTTFRLVLPLTVSTLRGVLVQAAGQEALIPSTFVERVGRVAPKEIATIESHATVLVEGRAVSLVRLQDILGYPPANNPDPNAEALPFVVVAVADRRIAFLVDSVRDELEVIQKTLGPQLARVRNIAGAAVLPSGKLVPILSVSDLVSSATTAPPPAAALTSVAPDAREHRRPSVLVVDDSITARTLLKNVLEAAGYLVRTAVDGAEAYASLREGDFDVVVSDVDMPRLNGFELTKKIRADRRISELPVILVTALESREDRERGIESGANAYIVKSSFEQGNLLEIVNRYV